MCSSSTLLQISLVLTLAFWVFELFIPGTSVRWFHVCYTATGLLAVRMCWIQRWWRNQRLLWCVFPAAVFVVVNLISFLVFFDDHDFVRLHPHPLKLLCGYGFFVVMVGMFTDRNTYSAMIQYLLLTLVLLIGVLIVQHYVFFKSLTLTPHFIAEGALQARAETNKLGMLVSLCFPLAYARLAYCKTVLNVVSLIILSVAAFYTFSRTALLLTCLSMGVLCIVGRERWRYWKQTAIFALAVVGVAGAFHFGPHAYVELKARGKWQRDLPAGINPIIDLQHDRAYYVRLGWEGFLQKPWFGHGLTSFQRQHPQYCPPEDAACIEHHGRNPMRRPLSHNDYIHVLYELGTVGVVCFVWLLWRYVVLMLKAQRGMPPAHWWLADGCLASMIVMVAALNFMNFYDTVLFWFFLSPGVILYGNQQENNL